MIKPFMRYTVNRRLLTLLALICLLPAGQAMAETFSRDPSANNWTRIGNSNTQATSGASGGGWAGGSSTANFDIYKATFTLQDGDTVAAPGTGTAVGDCFLASYASPNNAASAVAGCTAEVGSGILSPRPEVSRNPGTTWLAGDTIVAYGLKWLNGQQGSESGGPVFSFDPLGTSGFKAGTAFNTPGNTSFTNDSSDGSFGFRIYSTALQPQNRQPYGDYRVNQANGAINQPYGILISNDNNRSTIRQEGNCSNFPIDCDPQATLPVRSFGNFTGTGWDYYTVFLNQSLMQRSPTYGEAVFTSEAKWAITATELTRGEVTAASYADSTPIPGPLPILGVGSAFAWSRRLRVRLKDKFVSPGR